MKKSFIFILLCFPCIEINCQVFGNIIERMIQPTVLINVGKYSGSGILVCDSNSLISIITAKHVIYDPMTNFKKLNSNIIDVFFYAHDFKGDSANLIQINLNNLDTNFSLRTDSIHDICVVIIGKSEKSGAVTYYNGVSRFGYRANYTTLPLDNGRIAKKSEIFLGEDIFIVGFPKSLGLKQNPQFDYDKPLLKRGAIAGMSTKFSNFIIDCPVYHGNSGGPVFLERKDFEKYSIKLIGLVSEFIPLFTNTVKNDDLTVETSNYAVIVPIEYALNLWHC